MNEPCGVVPLPQWAVCSVDVVVFIRDNNQQQQNVPYLSNQLFVRLQQHPAEETQKEKKNSKL